MTPIEIMALVIALLSLIKLTTIIIKPKAWAEVVNVVYKNPYITTAASIILASISLFYLLQELTIVQIFASMFFLMFLMLIGFAAFSKETLAFSASLLRQKNILQRSWIPLVVWLGLVVWVLFEILF